MLHCNSYDYQVCVQAALNVHEHAYYVIHYVLNVSIFFYFSKILFMVLILYYVNQIVRIKHTNIYNDHKMPESSLKKRKLSQPRLH